MANLSRCAYVAAPTTRTIYSTALDISYRRYDKRYANPDTMGCHIPLLQIILLARLQQ